MVSARELELEAALAEARDRLATAEQKLVALSDSYPVGVYHADAVGARTYTNRRWQEIVGLDAAQSLGQAWLTRVHPEDAGRVLAAWRETVRTCADFDLQFRIVRPDGEVRTVRSRARAVVGGSSGAGFVGALEDLTDQLASEVRRRASEAFLAQAGRIAGVGGWEVELPSGVVTWSAQTRLIHEVDDDYVPSVETGIRFYAPEARPVIEAAVQRSLQSGQSWDLELPFTTAKGRALWVHTFGEAVYEEGRAVRLIGAFQDITAHRDQRNDLAREQGLRAKVEQHARELDELLREREEMIDVMAHEVRQPLNNASAALQSAAAALHDAGAGAAAERVTRAQTVMNQVVSSIDNTLAVAALLASAEPVAAMDNDIDTVLAVAIGDLPRAERSRVRIERLTEARTASMDTGLMRLAVRNLLANALKYSPLGSPVTVRVAESENPLGLMIDVEDSGVAIPEATLPRLFTRGTRGTHAGIAPGHGLGLYIVRRVMELHGGRAEVVRNTPDGVTFRLWLDLPTD